MGAIFNKCFENCFKSNKIYFHENENKIFGLKNLGNTCFMNSSLQCLINSTKLKERIETLYFNEQKNFKIVKEFKKLLLKAYSKEKDILLDPSNLKEKLGEIEEKYKYYEQNDANEFITIFLNQLLIELKGIGEYKPPIIPCDTSEKKAFEKLENRFFEKNKSFLLNLFYGRLKREYICENGHVFNVKFNNYNTLILPNPEESNKIIDLLNLYQAKKNINDSNFCNICKKEIKYSIKTSIYDIPEYFILCLEKEVIYSSTGLDYPEKFNCKEFMNNSSSNYHLYSLIIYSGNRKNGHYTAKVCKSQEWYAISDSYYKKIAKNEINDKNAIILFYKKE